MSTLTDDPRNMVNKTFDQGINLDKKDPIPADRKTDDPTAADDNAVAHGKKSVDADSAND